MFLLLLLYISGNILGNIANIDCAVDVLFQKNRFCSGKVLHLQTIFQSFIGRFYPPSESVKFSETICREAIPRQIGRQYFVGPGFLIQPHPYKPDVEAITAQHDLFAICSNVVFVSFFGYLHLNIFVIRRHSALFFLEIMFF